jgi:RNA polymerase sigma-B factor
MSSDQDLLQLMRSRPPGDPEREAACEKLVARHTPIVRSCVRRYPGYPEPEELMQTGYVGLLKAINNFDPAIGGKLEAYAYPCVLGEIKRYFRDRRWQMRVHRDAQELRLAIRAAAAELTQRLARAPTDAELARHLEVSEAEVSEAQLASRVFQVLSLDAPVATDNDDSLGDLIGAEDPQLEQTLNMDAVWQHCQELPRREQHLLMMRFYGDMSQAQIGREMGISQMHVSRLLSRALAYLREQITGISEPRPALGRPRGDQVGVARSA